MWQSDGLYEREWTCSTSSNHETLTFTGWYRCVGGRLADGRWPEWNEEGGVRMVRYRHKDGYLTPAQREG